MKSNVVWALAFGVTLLVLLTGVFLLFRTQFGKTPHVIETDQSEASFLADKFIEVPLVTDSERQETNPGNRYAYNVHFPTIAIMSHPDLAKEANAVVTTFVEDIIVNFTKNISEPFDNTALAGLTSDLSMRFTAQLVSPTIISIRFDISEYYAGAAHPNSRIRELNYDMEEHRILATSDLFASSTDALPFLSDFTRTQLEHAPNASFDESRHELLLLGTEPTIENFANIALNESGLVVFFNPYQIAPYARGSQTVPIPLEALNQLLIPRIEEAIRLGKANITEATPEK